MEPSQESSLAGKTTGILSRLAHFYHIEQAGGNLTAFVDMFARQIEQAEAVLYQVLRAHHIETADNEGGVQGYTASPEKRGDLDKIFALYLEALGGTDLLVKVSPYFTVRSINARRMVEHLLGEKTPLIAYLRQKIRLSTWKMLLRYDVSRMIFTPADIQPGFALALLLGKTGTARYVRTQLSPTTDTLLAAYTGSPQLAPALQSALAQDLNERLLRDLRLFRRNAAEFLSPTMPLSTTAKQLINSIYRDLLGERYAQEPNAEPAESPVGDDLVRLNRLLLEAAFPYDSQRSWGFRPRRVPLLQEVRDTLVQEVNSLLKDDTLYAEDRFPSLVEQYPHLKRRYRNDVAWLNRILLESAFPHAIEKSYAPYRERLLGLIRVLRRGAATRQGIVDIVAANLGIVGDDQQTRDARAHITIEEYAPQRATFFAGTLAPYQEFKITNDNPDPQIPEIRVTVLPDLPPLAVRFVDIPTEKQVCVNTHVGSGDTLVFKGTSVLHNGVPPTDAMIGAIPELPPGTSHWRFEASLESKDGALHPAGRFDETSYDTAVWVTGDPFVYVDILSYNYTPGTFTVVIPWHIPGFTDKFDETAEHPRHQILSLVNRVKAAGVLAQVAYKQVFSEDHNQDVHLELQASGTLLNTTHDMDDNLRASNVYGTKEDQDTSDTLSLAGHFDLTRFGSLNTFA